MLAWLRRLFRPAEVEYGHTEGARPVAPVAPPSPSVALPPVAPVNPPVDELDDARE